ncbi:ABC-three component system protein [Chitinophaga filiformis]|uniref:ABC-three component systems C-terminal domain-containing protein n=1 Tax=Chitinophaga filiformis TaxID=104663 RepID=A0A1G8E9R7_CHIFI|nr:ABC-three component system protein [Chitinophaga filiformis]SDH66653.1 hypothetical protein SAMN04488121_11748 [Chitinophaga filiformis]
MDSIFSASEPSLGYLYQIRYGLMLIVAEGNEDAKLLLEKIDDISIETLDSLQVYQTKLHISSVANLTNASTDLWKTIRVWSEGIKTGTLNAETDLFNLITTAVASIDTIPYKLKQNTHKDRNIDEILLSLKEVAQSSTNATNKPAYESFLSLSEDQQKNLIKKLTIVDASIDINEAKKLILHEVRHYSLKKESLYERLEGWFMGEAILQLQGLRDFITAKEVSSKIMDIADTFKSDNLPNDFNVPITSDETQLGQYRNKIFVKQMELIGSGPKAINNSISDYHRSFSQKSRWLREGLIHPDDEISYNKKLKEDWERKFTIIADSVDTDDDEIQKNKGKAFFETHYITQYPQIHIKERFKEQYMVTGSCHMLSDKKEVGWHPDFNNKLTTE